MYTLQYTATTAVAIENRHFENTCGHIFSRRSQYFSSISSTATNLLTLRVNLPTFPNTVITQLEEIPCYLLLFYSKDSSKKLQKV